MCVNVQSRSFIWSRDSRSVLLRSNVRTQNHFISRHIAGFGDLNVPIFLFMCQALTLMYHRGNGGVLKVKMAVVNPDTASVNTTRDSSLKIRLNQITKQTAKRIISDLSFFSLYQTDIKSAIYKIPSNDFLFDFADLIFWSHVWSESLSALTDLCPFVLPRGI